MTATMPKTEATAANQIDPVTAAVIHGALESIAVEMGHKLMRMSYSSIIRESEDFGTALTDATGRMTQGDLSARVDVPRSTELGALAESFNAMADKVEGTVAVLRRFFALHAEPCDDPFDSDRQRDRDDEREENPDQQP